MNILCFAEDPGACNYIHALSKSIPKNTLSLTILADGSAKKWFKNKEIVFEPSTLPPDFYINKYRPELIIVGTSANPYTYGLKLIQIAQQHNIKTLGIVDAPMHENLRFKGTSNSPITYMPHWISVPDEYTRQAFIHLGIHENHIKTCHNPHFDYILQLQKENTAEKITLLRKKHFPNIPAHHKIILFAGELETQPDQITNFSDENTKGRVISAKKAFLNSILPYKKDISTVLRLHPRNTLQDWPTQLINQFDVISQAGDALEILSAADIIVGLTSMLISEAALLGKPTLSIISAPEEKQWVFSIQWGLTKTAKNITELEQELLSLIKIDTDKKLLLPEKIQGKNSQSLLDFIQFILSQTITPQSYEHDKT